MKSKPFLKFIWVFFILLSCKSKGSRPSLSFEMRPHEEERCLGQVCGSIRLNYPFYLEETETAFRINNEIERFLIKAIAFEEPSENLPLAASGFLDSFENFVNDFGSFSDWFIETDIKETYQNDRIITVLARSSSFLGGAHPNSFQTFINFDKSSGEVIPLDLLITDEEELLEIVERKFKVYHGIPEEVPLKDDGRFFLKNDTAFFLPANMGFTEEGFKVIYNPYEVGPYVLGYTELQFTWVEIGQITNTWLKK